MRPCHAYSHTRSRFGCRSLRRPHLIALCAACALTLCSENQHTAKSELDETQIKALEEHEISQGPLSVLQTSVRSGTQILVALRNNRKLLGKVKAFDRHANMVLENVKEMWTEAPKGKGKKPINKDRFVSKMFLRGDSVVLVLRNT
ncbi:small nuclear ribonucleoprotein Sm D2 [Microbotryum lychnidis-dioicae p1A1 Lamole]|uniref:Small nuclear ribonucleoprotein Sm D2 n=1 Tax=Microbotryum lychnidis-dioicae (strain p1A1 Lamole / MvSl-1064) TaxID=683840 RepID=U5HBR1_USTV1|nr:small nuclear ribonucleoprotein Sm D2 [Microbotryum lychnidis-dioicae p1A1 Lamole]|eukprot:KDE04957.1 small nuclear ribonucleoprotein Sm D2 [Microbotryum lychnidis-dioicae p1A1 Lamole]